jgi:hypothetical protein
MEGEKMDSHGKVLKMFSPLKILNSPFSKEKVFWRFSSFLFFASFSFFLCSFLFRMNLGFFEMFDENFFPKFLSNGMEVATPRFMKLKELWKIYRWWMYTPEWTYAR